MEIDEMTLIEVLQGKLANAVIREAQLEAAIRQLEAMVFDQEALEPDEYEEPV